MPGRKRYQVDNLMTKMCTLVGKNYQSLCEYRVMVVQSFMKAGVTLEKMDCFRGFLEENTYRLTRSHLHELISFTHHQEVAKVKNDIKEKCVSVIFDGATHACEAMAIVLHFAGDNWDIQQRVVWLMLIAKSMTGEEVAR